MSDYEYIIVGDADGYKECLVYVCGGKKEDADRVLKRMLTEPTENDLKLMQGHSNFRVKEVPKEDCWWNGYLD